MSSTKGSYDYNSLKVSELRELLKENDLPISGIKAELVERLTVADVKNRMGGDNLNVPSNLSFMKQTDDSEEWDEEIVNEEEDHVFDPNETVDFDPNQTVLNQPKARKSKGRRQEREFESKRNVPEDEFRATRVFVQGIPKDATWQDVSLDSVLVMSLIICFMVRN